MRSKRFWLDAAERAVVTAVQVVVATLSVDQVTAFSANWTNIRDLALTAALLSLGKSIIATRRGNPEDASLVK